VTNLRIEALRSNTSDFAQSLCSQFDSKGFLSDKQMFWVDKLVDEADQPTPSYGTVDADMTGIVKLMHDATENLKWPKIRLATKDDKPVVLSVAGPNSKTPGAINVTDGGPYGNNTWYGRIQTDGEFQPSRSCNDEVVDLLVNISDHPVEAAAAHGHKTGNCCFCSRQLTDKRSTDVGYGPVCAGNYGLPWGECEELVSGS
jgi:hypothetical protein